MRLSQLARELEISPSELIIFFKKNDINHYTSYNNKVSLKDHDLAYEHYKTKVVEKKEENNGIVKMKPDQEKLSDKDIIEPGEKDLKIKPITQEKNEDNFKDNHDDVEVIRMPKIKLEGVKVVGKIELPEPSTKTHKKQESDQTSSTEKARTQKPTRKKQYDNSYGRRNLRKKPRRTNKKELSYEEKLKREEKKRIIEQQKIKKLKKEQKKQHYIKNVQSNVPFSKPKKKSKISPESEELPRKHKPEYKNPFRKIWAWLNGEYDDR